jgi:hypothetical protein
MRRETLGVALLSAATLAFEITLTRIFAVAQWYHFAFMAVSIALLGFGASGTALTVWPAPIRAPARWLGPITLTFGLGVVGSYLVVNYLPFDSYRIAWERVQLLYLAVYYLALTVPFFCVGLVVGALLASEAVPVSRIYAANLAGSGLGSLGALAALTWLSAPGVVLVTAAVGLLAAAVFGHASRITHHAPRTVLSLPKGTTPHASRLTHHVSRLTHHVSRFTPHVSLPLAVLLTLLALNPPRLFDLRMSPYKTLSNLLRYPDTRVTFTGWNAFSRVDAVESSTIRKYPGLSFSYIGDTPRQVGITVDGDNLSPITGTANPQALAFLDALPTALPFQLVDRPRTLVVNARGGLDVLQALHQGAASVTAVEDNPLIVNLVRDRYREFSGGLYTHPRVEVAVESGRGFARRAVVGGRTFDLVIISLADSFKVVNFGAYSLTESPTYTVEGVLDFYRLLSDEGLLVITRWLQVPPSESLRAANIVITALERAGVVDPAAYLVAYRTFNTMTLVVSRRPFAPGQLAKVRAFLAANGFDLVAAPDMHPAEANRYNVLEAPLYYRAFQQLLGPQRDEFIRDHTFDITPPTDDRPFFFHYFRWRQVDMILATLGKTWQPFGGGGYLVLVLLLILAVLASVVLIILPMLLRGARVRLSAPRPSTASSSPSPARVVSLSTLVVFFALGIGYLFVEIPLIQRFVVYLGHPTLAFAAVLTAVLVFSGVGSLLAPRLPVVPVFLVVALGAIFYPMLLRPIINATLGASLPLRLGVTVISLAPLATFMGMPFPRTLSLVRAANPGLVPWAWAINGCASVLSAILAAMLAVSVGFSAVLAAAGAAYLVGLLAAVPLQRA